MNVDWRKLISILTVALLLAAFAATQCRGDEYAASEAGIWQLVWNEGQPKWLKISKAGDLVVIHGIGAPPIPPGDDDDDDDDDTPAPTDLANRVQSAVLATKDSTNAGYLRDLYTIGVTMLDADAPTLSVITILKLGESRIIDTSEERRLWAAYLSITKEVYERRPAVRSQDIRDIAAGINAATEGPSRIYYLRKK